LHDVAPDAQIPRCREQVAAALAMEAGVVGQGFDDVGGIGGKPSELVDHHVRLCRFDCRSHRFGVEGIGGDGRDPQLAEAIHARAGACHARHLVPERAERAHERQAHGARGARDKDLHDKRLSCCSVERSSELDE
jgi:hypothetical protein